MRDQKRIDEVLRVLREVWTANPDIRLGQLVVNAARLARPNAPPFYVEDDDMYAALYDVMTTGKWTRKEGAL